MRGDTTAEVLRGLKPAFKKDGSVTAGNAPPVNDGAAALVVMAEDKMKSLDVKPMARIVAQATSGLAPKMLLMTPVEATRKVLKKAGWSMNDVDLIELNEAFAVQAVAVMSELGIDPAKVNVNGGAVALGHPIGASGARILTTLIYALKDRGLKRGIATLCLGGGNGVALAIELANGSTVQPLAPIATTRWAEDQDLLDHGPRVVRDEVVEPVAPRDRLEHERVREVELRRSAATAPSRRAAACRRSPASRTARVSTHASVTAIASRGSLLPRKDGEAGENRGAEAMRLAGCAAPEKVEVGERRPRATTSVKAFRPSPRRQVPSPSGPSQGSRWRLLGHDRPGWASPHRTQFCQRRSNDQAEKPAIPAGKRRKWSIPLKC